MHNIHLLLIKLSNYLSLKAAFYLFFYGDDLAQLVD